MTLSYLKSDFKPQDMVVGSPANVAVYVTGMAISELIYSSPAIVMLTLLFYLFAHVRPAQIMGIVMVLLLMFLTPGISRLCAGHDLVG